MPVVKPRKKKKFLFIKVSSYYQLTSSFGRYTCFCQQLCSFWEAINEHNYYMGRLKSWANLAQLEIGRRLSKWWWVCECSTSSFCSTFCERTKFCWTLLCSTFYVFALFGIHCYSRVSADFKGDLVPLKLGSVMKYVGQNVNYQIRICVISTLFKVFSLARKNKQPNQ